MINPIFFLNRKSIWQPFVPDIFLINYSAANETVCSANGSVSLSLTGTTLLPPLHSSIHQSILHHHRQFYVHQLISYSSSYLLSPLLANHHYYYSSRIFISS
ncbi:hypothetical protein DICVIV_05773 [Dictyocaulus viviparus]|uniref:Uncharacterized protein n=1 Tax=Dictyocaulus viviparus TaxID=29172 RepID=A0A0D8XWF9_DICVI|nr:hypothetical protein DICVIV_05773 [Dictyocaulus viviparus]